MNLSFTILGHRFSLGGRAAAPPPVQRGSIAPFDRIGSMGEGSMEKLTQPFASSVWVQAAIRKVIAPVTSVPVQFFADARAGKQPVTDPGLAAFWQTPALGAGGSRLRMAEIIEASLGWLLLEGEFFWLLDSSPLPFPEIAPGGGVKPFLITRPDRMRAIVSAGVLQEWAFTDGAGRTTLLDPAQVVHIKCWNPYSPFRGLAPWRSAEIATEADYLAGRFNLNLMKNNGDTGPFIIGKSGIPDDAQREQITLLLRQKKEMSLRGQFRPVFLGGDITVEDPTIKAPDAAFVAVRLENRHEIFIAFGVPPSMADVKAAYSIGSDSDRHALITETCIPASEKIADAIEAVMSRQTGKTIYAEFDWSRHSVMAAARNERLTAAGELWNRGMPWEKISAFLDLRLPEFDGWQLGYLPFNVAPVGQDSVAPAADPSLAEDAPQGAVAAMLRALRGNAEPETRNPKLSTRSSQLAKLWSSHIRARAGRVNLFKSKVGKILNTHRARVLAKLSTADVNAERGMRNAEPETPNPKPQTRALIDLIFDPDDYGSDLAAELRRPITDTLQAAGNELRKEIGLDDPWKMPNQKAIDYFNSRTQDIMGSGEAVRSKINTTLQQGLTNGETMSELADRIKAAFNDLSKFEATRVARTEVNIAYNDARQDAMADAGIEYKAWLSSHGPHARYSHELAEVAYSLDNPIPLDEPFTVGGEELMFPGDASLGATAANIINCQCIQLAARAPKEKSSGAVGRDSVEPASGHASSHHSSGAVGRDSVEPASGHASSHHSAEPRATTFHICGLGEIAFPKS